MCTEHVCYSGGYGRACLYVLHYSVQGCRKHSVATALGSEASESRAPSLDAAQTTVRAAAGRTGTAGWPGRYQSPPCATSEMGTRCGCLALAKGWAAATPMCSGEPSGLQTDTRGALASAVVLQGKLGSGHAPGGRPRNAGGAVDEPRAAAQQPAADRRPPPCPRPLGAVTQLADGAAALHLRRGQPARIRGSGLPSLIASAPEARTGHAPRASTRSRQPRHAKSRIRLFSPPLKRYPTCGSFVPS